MVIRGLPVQHGLDRPARFSENPAAVHHIEKLFDPADLQAALEGYLICYLDGVPLAVEA